jgi:ubiquinol-cytochrome c reductase cytochrome c subunit
MTAGAGKVKGARDLFQAAMSRLREEQKAAMSRLREKQKLRFRSTSRSRRRLRRRLSAGLLLMAGLLLAGGLAATLTPKPQVAVADESALSLVRNGRQIYETSCVSCHGANLQGMPDRGPSLIGVGEAAVYFQVSTGRMPAMGQGAQAPQKPPNFDENQVEALMAYVQANGGGPTVPRDPTGGIAQESLIGDDVARGGDLFRLNCASCHNFTGKGGALSSGKYAPDLGTANPAQIYAAMLSGPQNMPKFSDRQLTPDEKKDIIAYIKMATDTKNQGGYGLGGFGPTSEAWAMWLIGIVAIIGVALWIGSRA